MNKLIPVRNENHLYRNEQGAILNMDEESRKLLRARRKKEEAIKQYSQEINTLKEELLGLKEEIQKLYTLIKR